MRQLNIIVMCVVGWTSTVFAAEPFDSSFLQIDMPTKMLVGNEYSVKFVIKNSGSQNWTNNSGIAIEAIGNEQGWRPPPFDVRQNISPGKSKELRFKFSAPQKTGLYPLQFKMTRNNKTFGEFSDPFEIVVETVANRVKFISQVIPQNMETGKTYPVIVQFKNEGRTTWTSDVNFKLGSFKSDAKEWKQKYIKLKNSAVVPPGEIGSFRFELKAPRQAGTYQLQWRLLKGRNNWFGEPTPKLVINVTQGQSELNSEFAYQTLPGLRKVGEYFSIFETGKVYAVSMTFKNNGTQPWLPGIYRLVSLEKSEGLVWSVDPIELKPNEVIPAGGMKSFNFQVISPLKPGIYDFQWQIRKGKSVWVGEASDNVVITVK